MAINIRFDTANNPMPSRLILATKSGSRIRELPMNEVKFREGLMDGSEFSFKVYKKRCLNRSGQVDTGFWKKITDFKLAYCPEFDMWYELHIDINESTEIVKTVEAVSLGEAETSQINVYGMEVNTEDDIARDDYQPTTIFSATNKDCSLVDRLLYKAPHYRIAHVDESLANIQRTFQFDKKSMYDCFKEISEEIDCLVKIECVKGTDTKIDRKISLYDLENYCLDCGNRGDFIGVCDKCGSDNIRHGYGDDTSVYVSVENLAEEITYTTDTDSVKNCFRLEGGDDLMTATIINCNPNGSQYIWCIPDEQREDMSPELRQKLKDYDEMHELYQYKHGYKPQREQEEDIQDDYNKIVWKYRNYNSDLEMIPSRAYFDQNNEEIVYPVPVSDPEADGRTVIGYPALMTAYYDTIDLQLFLNSGLMPNVEIASTDAATEAGKLDALSLSPVAVSKVESCTSDTAANAALAMAKCLVRGSFGVKVKDSNYTAETHVWTGNFTVTNYSDEEDKADSETVSLEITGDMEEYIKQKMKRAMKKESDDVTDISQLFALEINPFCDELDKYSLQRLMSFRDACQASMDILIQQGVADQESWAATDSNLYQSLYLPYRQKASAIEDEILERTQEIAVVAGVRDEDGNVLVEGMQTLIEEKRTEIQGIQNFEEFLGPELWNEFAAYRREDVYENSNYISDGLNNEQLFARAMQFVELAEKEIYSSAKLQHSLTADMHNLLAMREFQPLTEKFACGNWIRVRADDKVYRLRLSEYSVDYNNFGLDVEFTDVKFGHNTASDIKSLLQQAQSMSSSYGSVTRQAEKARRTDRTMRTWAEEGFSLTTKIVGGAENQEFIMNNSGITGREYIPETESYSDEQIKMISSGLYITDDGWLTAKTGVGKFTFVNPKTKEEETRYGVIADLLVGNMVLSREAGIYNDNGSITMDNNGFTLITEAGQNAKTFSIIRQEPNGDRTNILSIDSNGRLQLNSDDVYASIEGQIETVVGGNHTRSFTEQPTPPYNVGEIWFDGETGKLYTCMRAKSGEINEETGEDETAFDADDWTEIVNYTDMASVQDLVGDLSDSVANQFANFQTSFLQTQNSFTYLIAEKTEALDTVETYMQMTNRGLEIGKKENGTNVGGTLVCSNNQIAFEVGGVPVTYWTSDEQYMPKMVNIPVGGSMRLGSIQFQPRSSGNLSLLWVGEN